MESSLITLIRVTNEFVCLMARNRYIQSGNLRDEGLRTDAFTIEGGNEKVRLEK